MGKVTRITEYMGGILIISLCLVTVIDVVGRYIFKSPLLGGLELSELLLAILVGLGLVTVTARSEHIIVDILIVKLHSSTQRILLIIASFASAVFLGLLSWESIVYSLRSLEVGEFTFVLRLPVYLAKFLFTLGCFLAFIVLVGQIIDFCRGNRD